MLKTAISEKRHYLRSISMQICVSVLSILLFVLLSPPVAAAADEGALCDYEIKELGLTIFLPAGQTILNYYELDENCIEPPSMADSKADNIHSYMESNSIYLAAFDSAGTTETDLCLAYPQRVNEANNYNALTEQELLKRAGQHNGASIYKTMQATFIQYETERRIAGKTVAILTFETVYRQIEMTISFLYFNGSMTEEDQFSACTVVDSIAFGHPWEPMLNGAPPIGNGQILLWGLLWSILAAFLCLIPALIRRFIVHKRPLPLPRAVAFSLTVCLPILVAYLYWPAQVIRYAWGGGVVGILLALIVNIELLCKHRKNPYAEEDCEYAATATRFEKVIRVILKPLEQYNRGFYLPLYYKFFRHKYSPFFFEIFDLLFRQIIPWMIAVLPLMCCLAFIDTSPEPVWARLLYGLSVDICLFGGIFIMYSLLFNVWLRLAFDRLCGNPKKTQAVELCAWNVYMSSFYALEQVGNTGIIPGLTDAESMTTAAKIFFVPLSPDHIPRSSPAKGSRFITKWWRSEDEHTSFLIYPRANHIECKRDYFRLMLTAEKAGLFNLLVQQEPTLEFRVSYLKFSRVFVSLQPIEGYDYAPEVLETLERLNSLYP